MTGSRAGASSSPLLAWTVLVAVVAGRAYRALLLTLVVAAIAPALCGWHSYLVRTGSMRPALAVGDVVAASPFESKGAVPVGRVMVFTSPATGRTTIHRVVARASHGRFSTAGDANPNFDPAPAPRSALHGLARLRIPLIGLPVLWFSNGHIAVLIGWLIATAAAFLVATGRGGPGRPRPGPPGPEARADDVPPPRTVRHARRRRRTGLLAATLVAVPAITVVFADVATAAAFSASSRNAGNNWGVTTAPKQPYTKQVLADNPYFYYRVDEASGSIAADSSGNSRPGTYSGVSDYRVAGALPNNFGYSVGVNGSTRIVGGSTALSSPTTFTLELWFKTASTKGGKLIGFTSTTGANSLLYDRHIFMRTDGRLVYGGWLGGSTTTTPNTYNDNSWHHLVLTGTARAAQRQDFSLYVDSVAVASGTTGITSYSGYWQVGDGPLPIGIGVPNAGFIGNIDNVAVYQTALSPARVSAHYASR